MLANNQAPATFGVSISTGTATLVTLGKVSFNAKFISSTQSTLFANQPFAVAMSSRKAEAISPTNSGFGGVKRLGPLEKIGVKRRSKAMKKPSKTVRRRKAIPPP